MSATMHDVALMAGVSIKTVSNVINDYPHVRPATRTVCSLPSTSWAIAPTSRPEGCARARRGSSGSPCRSCGRTTSPSWRMPSSEPRRRRGSASSSSRPTGIATPSCWSISGARMHFTDGILFSPVGMGQADASLLDVPFPARASRRAHLRRPDGPRDDAQRVVGHRDGRAPPVHRAPAHRPDRRRGRRRLGCQLLESSRTRIPPGARAGGHSVRRAPDPTYPSLESCRRGGRLA